MACPAAAQEDGEWKRLFNGANLDGWTVKCRPADAGRNFWRVEDGTILADSMDAKGHDYLWLMTERQYGDFVLRLRFQAYRDSTGNSGVQVRSRYDDAAGWLDGPQVDIHPPGPWRTGMMWDETRGNQRWIFPDVPRGKWVDQSMAIGRPKFFYSGDEPAWNDLVITVKGLTVRTQLNGVLVTDFNGAGIIDSPAHQKHSVGTSGHIALQIHKGDQLRIRFKDIEIRE
jgi:hypothetical protein